MYHKQHVNISYRSSGGKESGIYAGHIRFNAEQQLDGCTTCYPSNPCLILNPVINSPITLFIYPGSKTHPDVHGMQMQSLQLSECFKQSTLTCIPCHSPHSQVNNNNDVLFGLRFLPPTINTCNSDTVRKRRLH